MSPQDGHRYLNPLPVLAYMCSPFRRPSVKYYLVFFAGFTVQHTPHTKFMDSGLQLASSIQLNDYTTRMLIDLGASRPLTLPFFLVMILVAVGYDYSTHHVSLCVSSHWIDLNIVSPHILRRGMHYYVHGMIYRNMTGCGFLQIEYIWVSGHSPHHYIFWYSYRTNPGHGCLHYSSSWVSWPSPWRCPWANRC